MKQNWDDCQITASHGGDTARYGAATEALYYVDTFVFNENKSFKVF